jgi:Leucine-rich repeat (LRR) protein
MNDKKAAIKASVSDHQLKIIQQLEEKFTIAIPEASATNNTKNNYYITDGNNIITLKLTHLKLKTPPKEILQLTELLVLDLSHNHLYSLPRELTFLEKLTILKVAGNQLSSIADWLSILGNLRELHLNNNHIRSLPKSIGKLSFLRRLYLQNNNIHSLPFSLTELKLLSEIHLDFRVSMKKTIRGILNQLETTGCFVNNSYNRR